MITLLALTSVLSVAAPSPKTIAPSPVDSSTMTVVVVQNNGKTPVTIYAETADYDIRLGEVGPYDTESLRVPDGVVGDGATVDFFVQPKRGLEQDSGYVELRHGEHIGLVVPSK